MTEKIKQQLLLHAAKKADRIYDLSQHSHARLGLGHTGGHLRTKDWLAYQLDFARAKDAVFSHYSTQQIATVCSQLELKHLEVYSQTQDTTHFLLHPELGRQLHVDSQQKLATYTEQHPNVCQSDILILISGGLSPIAIEQQIPAFLPLFCQQVKVEKWSLAPIIINQRGRVALGDHINHYFNANMVVVLIGERPGLSTPDSMGIYFTYRAKRVCTDEKRNCISNIHQRGMGHHDAVMKLAYLVRKGLHQKMTGVTLKDDFIAGN